MSQGELRIRLLAATAKLPTRAISGDAGLDVYASEAMQLKPGSRASVGTGIAVEIPEGHAGLVLPRSGWAARHGITLVNSPGLIDAGYRGEVRVLLCNTDRDETFEVTEGDRIAQLLVVPFALLEPREAEALSESERGDGGFGSSGN